MPPSTGALLRVTPDESVAARFGILGIEVLGAAQVLLEK
jgi:hypothetical protein